MTHYSDEDLWRYVEGPELARDRETIEDHLSICRDCQSTASSIRTFDAALRDEAVWSLSSELRAAPAEPPRALKTVAATLDREREEARAILAPAMVSPKQFEEAQIVENPGCHNPAAVALLCEHAEALRQRQPQFALMVATAAVAITGKLADAGMARAMGLRVWALSEQGAALFLIGRFSEAERVLCRAEDAIEKDGSANDWELARVWLIRGNLYTETGRLSEARPLAAAAANQFLLFADLKRYLSSRMLEGVVRYFEDDFEGALSRFEEITSRADKDEELLRGRALQNAGDCYRGLGDHRRALDTYFHALTIWDALDLDTERARTKWAISLATLAAGDLPDAIQGLERAVAQFEALGIRNDAALARLNLAEGLLLADEPQRVPDILRNVVVQFALEGMTRNANMALAYLHEAARAGRVTLEIVRDVRVYLQQLPARPQAAFMPRR